MDARTTGDMGVVQEDEGQLPVPVRYKSAVVPHVKHAAPRLAQAKLADAIYQLQFQRVLLDIQL
eukprot:1235654-Pyramimonas_sp.AAC.1